jgi:hypothetical protein
MIDAKRAHFGMLCDRRSPDDGRSDMLGDLGCGNADAPTHLSERAQSRRF